MPENRRVNFNVPEEVFAAMKHRLARDGVAMGPYLLRLIRQDLALPEDDERRTGSFEPLKPYRLENPDPELMRLLADEWTEELAEAFEEAILPSRLA